MSQHTPQHHEDPLQPITSGPGRDNPNLVDLVAGNPPVPITVWRTAYTDTDSTRSIPARLAYRLISAYSRPGDAVIDLTDDHVLAAVCAAGGRVHHRAWFTDQSNLIIAPATEPRTDTSDADDSDQEEAPELADWFGDDLTDPDLPCPDAPVDPAPGGSLHDATNLVAACWPLDDREATNRIRLAWLLAACKQLLRTGGCLVLVVGIPAGMRATPEDFSPVVAAAQHVGLGYLQHIVAVAADTDADGFVYHVTDEELLTLAHASAHPWTVAHRRVHADLLIFSQSPAPRTQPDGQGGGDRG